MRRIELLGGPQQLRHREHHLLLDVRREFPRRKAGVFAQRSRCRRALVLFGAERLEHERRHDRQCREQDREGWYAATGTAGRARANVRHTSHAKDTYERTGVAFKYAPLLRFRPVSKLSGLFW